MEPMVARTLKWIVGVTVLSAAAVVLLNLELPQRCIPIGGAGGIAIELTRLARGEAKLFCYNEGAGDKIRIILARCSDGTVHSVFDACRQCYSYRKGYRLTRNGNLICRLCGNRYSVDHMMAGKASCVPVAVPHTEDGSTVRISAADLRAGRGLF
jgi:uncharacterized membrane protein